MIELVAAVGIINLFLSGYLLYKIRKIHLASFSLSSTISHEANVLFNQIQAYQGLLSLLEFRKPLPPLGGWAASPDFLIIVASHALSRKPETVVECGSGASTIVLARCCEVNGSGHVYSLEQEAEYAEQTREQIQEQGLTEWATVVDAPLVSYPALENRKWYSLEGIALTPESIEMLVVDGPPAVIGPLARYPALPLLYPNLSSGFTAFLDDTKRTEEKRAIERWLSEFPRLRAKSFPAKKGCVAIYLEASGASEMPAESVKSHLI